MFDLARSLGLVFQDPDSQIFSIAVEDEISFGPENMGLEKNEIKRRVESVMENLKIKDLKAKDTFALSLGQKQKVCMASVLSMEPEILVLDEPTSQLDFRGTKGIYDTLKDINKKGGKKGIFSSSLIKRGGFLRKIMYFTQWCCLTFYQLCILLGHRL